jgi:hypothetical protein
VEGGAMKSVPRSRGTVHWLTIRKLGIASALASVFVAGSGGASAAARSSAAGAAEAATAVPGGYKIVSAKFTAPAGMQVGGSVTCPATSSGVTRYPQSGGVFTKNGNLHLNLNNSFPSGTGWYAYVNNGTGTNQTFKVYAICAKPKTGYVVVNPGFVGVSPNSQGSFTQPCPQGTKILGGGAYSTVPDLGQNMSSSFPSGNGWRVDFNDNSASATSFEPFAVCSKYGAKTGYTVISGSPVPNPTGQSTPSTVPCPSGLSVLGGGVATSSGQDTVNINSTFPQNSTTWGNVENNASNSDDSVTPYAICAA